MSKTHLLIPDMQIKASESVAYAGWVGRYIASRKPDVIVNIGDFADMESLSSYDKGKKSFEGRRYKKDIAATHRAMDLLMEPIAAVPRYKPRLVLTMGNHEARINRVAELQSEFDGLVSLDDLAYADWGWEVHDFLKPVRIDGIAYCHYFVNPDSLLGNALGGSILNRLTKLGTSFTQGHQQHFLYGERHAVGSAFHGLVAGACYPYYDEYRGPQNNDNWRGVVVKHEVDDGQYDIMKVSLNYIERNFKRKSTKKASKT